LIEEFPLNPAAGTIVDLYDRHAATWVEARLHERELYERAWLDRFTETIPAGGQLLDLGCGAGAPIAKYLSERGYAVTGVDSSPAMVAMFEARLPNQQVLVADMRALDLNHRFHGILAWDSFFHLNHEDQRSMFAVFRAHAAPRAMLMFNSGPSHGEAIGSLEGEPLYHASLDAAEYHRLLEREGFAVIANVADDQTCRGRTVWLAQLQ
jgi:trans-aconitate methyltransferase